MHELAATENLLHLALEQATQAQARQVTDLYLLNGPLSGISDDSVQFYWDALSRDTLCEGAQLHFEHATASLKCLTCRRAFASDGEPHLCPYCQSGRVQVTAGNNFRLASIEIVTAGEPIVEQGVSKVAQNETSEV